MKPILDQLKELREVQSECLSDDYMFGLYNGLELAISILENREPQYKDPPRKYDVRRNLYEVQHTDEVSLVRFALCMRDKLAVSRSRGRHGWETAPGEYLTELLVQHLIKGDPVDVANFCMMLHQRGDRIYPTPAIKQLEDDGK